MVPRSEIGSLKVESEWLILLCKLGILEEISLSPGLGGCLADVNECQPSRYLDAFCYNTPGSFGAAANMVTKETASIACLEVRC